MDQDFEKLDRYFDFRRRATAMAVLGGFTGILFSLLIFAMILEYVFRVVHSLSEPARFIGFVFMLLAISPYVLLGPLGGFISCRIQLKRHPEIIDKADPGGWGVVHGVIAGIVAGFLPVIPAIIILFYNGD